MDDESINMSSEEDLNKSESNQQIQQNETKTQNHTETKTQNYTETQKQPQPQTDTQKFYVYCLKAVSSETTYVGATTDVNRRLRQHNKEIKGGAKATSVKVNQGDSWERVCYVEGFPDWKSALQFEWMWKHLTKKQSKTNKPIMRRVLALHELLHLEKATSKATPYKEWITQPKVNVEQYNHFFKDW